MTSLATPDVLIIGAGPAGSIAATLLARAGYSIILTDRAPFPRPKVCGGCLSPVAIQILNDLNLEASIQDATTINTFSLRAGSAAADIPATGYRAIARDVFDNRLVIAAQQTGATFLPGHSARVHADHSVELSSPAGITHFKPAYILASDGISGTSLSDLPEFTWKTAPSNRMGIGTLLTRAPVPLKSDEILMLCHRDGYVGMVRFPDGSINLAAALFPEATRAAGGPSQICDSIIRSCFPQASQAPETHLRGTPLLTRKRARIESGNILLIGDAAAYVEPFTGEGMTWAIQSAESAVHVISHALQTSQLCAGQWTATHRRLLFAPHLRCRALAAFIRHTHLLKTSLKVMNRFPQLAGRAAGLFLPPLQGSPA